MRDVRIAHYKKRNNFERNIDIDFIKMSWARCIIMSQFSEFFITAVEG